MNNRCPECHRKWYPYDLWQYLGMAFVILGLIFIAMLLVFLGFAIMDAILPSGPVHG